MVTTLCRSFVSCWGNCSPPHLALQSGGYQCIDSSAAALITERQRSETQHPWPARTRQIGQDSRVSSPHR
ncbi:hypothetical protein E2C01_070439 [Portunus trituberculatus]|uniref:Uncharacterized protein n=1 Tax=Portunus trituberculatus TaxID=210409 RepID=A0A5B7I594_PORTR|nr:hypothetical protein [Portunus trituberculatus]